MTWLEIPNHFPGVILDVFVIMPNHVHGIIDIDKYDGQSGVGATHTRKPLAPCESPLPLATHSPRPCGPKPQSIGAIIGSFKSAARTVSMPSMACQIFPSGSVIITNISSEMNAIIKISWITLKPTR